IAVQPTVQDLFGNRIPAPIRVVFSTGPEIPDTRLEGEVADRVTGGPVVGVRVEAILTPDSLVYATLSDSAGGYLFRQIPEGGYEVRGFRDTNANRLLEPYEPRDTGSARVAAATTARVRLRLLLPDSTPPQIASVRVAGDSMVEVRFDDPLDPAQSLASAVTLLLPSGEELPLLEVTVGTPRPRQAPGAADPVGAPAAADSARAPGAPVAPVAPATPRAALADPLPSTSLFVRTVNALPAAMEILVRVRGVQNLHGLRGEGEASVRTPAAPAVPPPPPVQPR
nr:carboxypeptidase-like regulatory domain-containing protein [Gemmatimonadota bacterium]